MKTKEELHALKGEVETLNKKLAELTDHELEEVTAGSDFGEMMKKVWEIGKKVYKETKPPVPVLHPVLPHPPITAVSMENDCPVTER